MFHEIEIKKLGNKLRIMTLEKLKIFQFYRIFVKVLSKNYIFLSMNTYFMLKIIHVIFFISN